MWTTATCARRTTGPIPVPEDWTGARCRRPYKGLQNLLGSGLPVMKLQAKNEWSYLEDEVLDLMLDEAERAIFDVEGRSDERGRRVALLEADPPGVSDLRLAIAELVDAYPGIQYELESVGDRLRNVGALAATGELESRPHLMHLVRLSLEAFFRHYPTVDAYEKDDIGEDPEEDARTPAEIYETYERVLEMLRARLS